MLAPLLLLVSLFLLSSLVVSDINRDCPFTQDNSIYGSPSCGHGLTFNITAPEERIASIGYFPNYLSPPILPRNPGESVLTMRVLTPHPDEPLNVLRYGCKPSLSASTFYSKSTDRNNHAFTGEALIVYSSGCSLSEKQRGAQELGVRLLIVVDEFSLEFARPSIYSADSRLENSIPTISVARKDGEALMILDNSGAPDTNTVVDVRMSIATSGVANAITKQRVYNITKNLKLNPAIEGALTNTHLTTFSAFNTAQGTTDPCSNGLIFFWCENGEIAFFGISWSGTTGILENSAFSALGTIVFVRFEGNHQITGPFPNNWCDSQSSAVLWREVIIDNNRFSSLPNCFDKSVSLKRLSFMNNLITVFPSTLIQSNIQRFQGDNNLMTGNLPNLQSWTSLKRFSIQKNQFNGILPDFSGMPNLELLDLSYNQFSGLNSPQSLDNLGQLTSLILNNNKIASVLPELSNTYTPGGLAFQFRIAHNQFTGDIPSSWDFFKLNDLFFFAEMDFSYNSFTNPYTYQRLKDDTVSVTLLDLSHNQLIFTSGTGETPMEWIVYMSGVPNIKTLDISYNNIQGTLPSGFISSISSSSTLKRLSLAGNPVTNVPADVWSVKWESLNFSYCAVEGSFEDIGVPHVNIAYLGLIGNPKFISTTKSLPSWIEIDNSLLTLTPGQIYACYSTRTPQHPILTLTLDASYSGYAACSCSNGYYGHPSTGCLAIPSIPVQVNPSQKFPRLFTNGDIPAYTFTDNWFGTSRQISGMDVEWRLTGENILIAQTASGEIGYFTQAQINAGNASVANQTGAALTFSPARLMYLFIHLDLSLFNTANDIITVYSFIGIRRTFEAEIRGSVGISYQTSPPVPLTNFSQNFPAETQTLAYKQKYYDQYRNFSNLAIFRIPIYTSNVALINFQSRKSSGVHFFTSYVFSSEAPSGYTLNKATGLFEADIPIYSVNSGLLTAMYAVAGVICAIILSVIIFFFKRRSSAVVRASSKPFVFFILGMLLAMAGTSVLYAIVPNDSSVHLCHARVWCSCITLMSILGVLFAKSFRIALIFDQKSMRVKSVSDLKVAGIAASLVMIQVLMCAIFSGVNMSWPEYISNGTNEVVRACNTGRGFNTWVGVNIAIFALTMVAGAFIAFKTRNVPSAFNESHHILYSLVLLLFFLLMLVPLDWLLVSNSPEASVVIQAAGQLLLAFFLLVFNYAPKVYYLFSGLGDAKSLTQVSQKSNLSSAPTRSQVAPDPNGRKAANKQLEMTLVSPKAGKRNLAPITGGTEASNLSEGISSPPPSAPPSMAA